MFRAGRGKGPTQRVMKSVGGPLHQRILRFGGRFIAGITPIAARAGADSVTGKPSATPDHNVRRVFFDGIYGTGFTLCPPLEIGPLAAERSQRPAVRQADSGHLQSQHRTDRKTGVHSCSTP